MWKEVKGYEDKYLVSDKGEVKSIKRDKILSPKNNWDGYLRIQLWKNNKCVFVSIHRLVAEAFLEKPVSCDVVNHVNGIKSDNRVENLEWVTQRDNVKHAWKNGLCKSQLNNSKLSKPVDQLDSKGNYIQTFPSQIEAERKLDICRISIGRVCSGKAKIAGGFKWRFSETSND